MAAPVKDAAWLAWIEGLMGAGSRRTQTAALPQGQFHCLLDELPLHLIPKRQWMQMQDIPDELFLNPHCSFFSSGQFPAELEPHHQLIENFYLRAKVAWVRDSVTSSLNPFWLGSRLEAAVASLRAGETVSDSVPANIRLLLATAGILTKEHEVGFPNHDWNEVVANARRQFQEKGYAPFGGLIHPFHIAALRRYYRYKIRSGAIWLGDYQSSRRFVAHNETVARFFHHQIAGIVSEIVGEPVKPSYVYLASYRSGAELKKHTDREQCEFSVTLCLDFSPEPSLATPWPIRLDTPAGEVTVYQALGDGLVYRGTKIPHYRHALSEGHTSTSIFFHYVHQNFSGSLN